MKKLLSFIMLCGGLFLVAGTITGCTDTVLSSMESSATGGDCHNTGSGDECEYPEGAGHNTGD